MGSCKPHTSPPQHDPAAYVPGDTNTAGSIPGPIGRSCAVAPLLLPTRYHGTEERVENLFLFVPALYYPTVPLQAACSPRHSSMLLERYALLRVLRSAKAPQFNSTHFLLKKICSALSVVVFRSSLLLVVCAWPAQGGAIRLWFFQRNRTFAKI